MPSDTLQLRLFPCTKLNIGSMIGPGAEQILRITFLFGTTLWATMPSVAFAQKEDTEIWIGSTAAGSVSGPWLGSIEAALRIDDANTREPTRIIRPMLGYRIKNVSMWVGYARVEQFPTTSPKTSENRLFQQLNWNIGKTSVVRLSSRTRLEQRYFGRAQGAAWRIREQIKATVPLVGSKVGLVATTEPFFTVQTSVAGAQTGLEQWRSSIGIVLSLSESLAFEVGYLNRYTIHHNAPDKIDHIFPLMLAYRF